MSDKYDETAERLVPWPCITTTSIPAPGHVKAEMAANAAYRATQVRAIAAALRAAAAEAWEEAAKVAEGTEWGRAVIVLAAHYREKAAALRPPP